MITISVVEKRRKELGARIAKRRQELNMSMDQLASLMGYKHRSSIQKLESGENGLPQDKIEQLAECLQTTPAELMGWVKLDVRNSSFAKLMEKALEPAFPTDDEYELLFMYSQLNSDGQELVVGFINSLLQNPKFCEKDTNSVAG